MNDTETNEIEASAVSETPLRDANDGEDNDSDSGSEFLRPRSATPKSVNLDDPSFSTDPNSMDCPACKGQHRAHTCSRAKDQSGPSAATSSAPRCNRCKHCLKPRWKKRCLNLAPESPSSVPKGELSPNTPVGVLKESQVLPTIMLPKAKEMESQESQEDTAKLAQQASSPRSPPRLGSASQAEQQRRKEHEELRRQEEEKDAAEAQRQQQALQEVAERLAKEKAVQDAKLEIEAKKERDARDEAEDKRQAEQAEEVIRRMQERAIRKRSLTPFTSPMAGPPPQMGLPAYLSLDGDSRTEDVAEKRKAASESPDSPGSKKASAKAET